jgi:predicted neutral ceramidase superfamily lipid hydrolase
VVAYKYPKNLTSQRKNQWGPPEKIIWDNTSSIRTAHRHHFLMSCCKTNQCRGLVSCPRLILLPPFFFFLYSFLIFLTMFFLYIFILKKFYIFHQMNIEEK